MSAIAASILDTPPEWVVEARKSSMVFISMRKGEVVELASSSFMKIVLFLRSDETDIDPDQHGHSGVFLSTRSQKKMRVFAEE